MLQRIGLIILVLAGLASVMNALTLSSNAKVVALNSQKSQAFLSSSATYEQAVHDLLASSIWNHNKITVNTKSVTDKLTARYPELSSASITIPLLAHRPVVYVQAAQPILVIAARNGYFIVADTGEALARANTPAQFQKYNLPNLTDQSGLKLQAGHKALSTTNVSFIQTVITELAAKQFIVSAMVLPAGSNELDVSLKGQAYLVKFNLGSDSSRAQAGTFLSTIKYLQQQNTIPSKYIDVRVVGKAYYQ